VRRNDERERDEEAGNGDVQADGAGEAAAEPVGIVVVEAGEDAHVALGVGAFKRAGDDGDVGDAGLLNGVHDGGEGAEGHLLIGADVDDALGAGGRTGAEEAREVVDVDGLVLQEDTGAVTMKIRSSTRTTSTSGVMLMSESADWVRPLAEKAMTRASVELLRRPAGGARR
jgi:hypothetical protein